MILEQVDEAQKVRLSGWWVQEYLFGIQLFFSQACIGESEA